MTKDLMYCFLKDDSTGKYVRSELGEIQTGFNMSFVIDGTKDSMQIEVLSYSLSSEVKPNTILYHPKTDTWWIVKKDIIKRYANEIGFDYKHTLTLLGAIDLLSSRDLIDCGFNDNTYTITTFIAKLFYLSTFEFDYTISYKGVDGHKNVDYIKSFENYVLLSALREFLNGYNCDAKLTFETETIDNIVSIKRAILTIIPKSGDLTLEPVDISVFDDVREAKSMDKASYGTTVVTNAQNVVSTITKTYPQTGGVDIRTDRYEITSIHDSANYLELPSPAYQVNWVKAISPVKLYAIARQSVVQISNAFFPQNESAFEKAIEEVCDGYQYEFELRPYIEANKELVRKLAIGCSQVTFPSGFDYNPHTHDFIKGKDTLYFPRIIYTTGGLTTTMVLADKQTHDLFRDANMHGFYWERGSNKIKGFESFDTSTGVTSGNSPYVGGTDAKMFGFRENRLRYSIEENAYLYVVASNVTDSTNPVDANVNHIGLKHTVFQINYIPMSDLKIKVDNQNQTNDTHIYNQNGKLNDSVALSKLLDSYSKEIENDTITRYMQYYRFSDIPKIGQLVMVGNVQYVINNISYDITVNENNDTLVEDFDYYYDCEFTLSKSVATKSIMTNPNSNVRDYGIPQKYNVKRRQVYRDFFEFTLTEDENSWQDEPYVGLDNYLYFGNDSRTTDYDHTAIMKITYSDLVDGHTEWYYQLNTIAFVVGKSIYEVLDFNDNNIIGYDMQNATTGFDMSNIWNVTYADIQTPVSYVDDNGEFQDIDICFVNAEQLGEMYQEMYDAYNVDGTYMFSAHCFVGKEFYEGKDETQSDHYDYDGIADYLDTQENAIQVEGVPVTTCRIDLDMDYIGIPESVVFSSINITNLVVKYPSGSLNPSTLSNAEIYRVSRSGRILRIVIIDKTTQYHSTIIAPSYVDVNFRINYEYVTGDKVITGAIDRADYILSERFYDKDAIEVPVFEYSMQIGDSEDVEVGDQILNSNNGLVALYQCVIKNAHSTSQLNASAYFEDLTIDGDTLVGNDNFEYQYEVVSPSGVSISLENDNKTMRVKVYNNQTAEFFGTTDQDAFELQSVTLGSTQMTKSQLIGKDIVIYKSVINSMHYQVAGDLATCDFENKLMFIIHNPQEANFDGDDLLVSVNYYKLR